MASFKILGLRIQLGKKAANSAPVGGDRRKASTVIRKQPKRQVSYQIADIKNALQGATNIDSPDRGKLLDIYDYIIKDGRLKSQMRTAKIKAKSEPWLLYVNGQPDDLLSQQFRKTWFTRVIEAILESEFYGFSVVELDIVDPAKGLVTVKILDRRYISIEQQAILIEGTINGAKLPYAEIMWDIDLVEFGTRDNLGTLLESAYNVIWKFYSRSDWSRASEKVGMPILSIEANTNNDTELDNIEQRAANFGSDGYIVTQAGDKTTLIERKSDRLHDIFLDNMKYCDEEIGNIVNGQTATSDTQAFTGSSQVQERTMEDYTTDRLQTIADEMNEHFLPYLVSKKLIAEGVVFDYPELIRTRERRILGQQTKTDAPAAPQDTAPAEPKPVPAKPAAKK